MTVVADISPLHYVILIGCVGILLRPCERIFTAPAVMKEMEDASAPCFGKIHSLHPFHDSEPWGHR